MTTHEPFYITTAIDYVNGEPHLGHAYEKIAADVIARFMRRQGRDVHFLTGLDEHGMKVARTAEKAGKDPQSFVDELAARFIEVYDHLGISYDDFIRTTQERHARGVIALLERIRERNPDDLFEGTYEGWYCVGCEAYKTDKDLVDGECPDHPGQKASWVQERNLFFRLSRYAGMLRDHITAHPEVIVPEARRNEILAVIDGGLEDISISRPNLPWGIPIPFHRGSTVYVWFDALANYITALGFGDGEDAGAFERYWPADLHVIGKDITRFHCIIWPAMLAAAGLPMARQVHAHGWVTLRGQKQSKMLGNVVSPLDVVDRVGADPLRYYLMAEVTFGRDGDFSWERFEACYNSRLANEYGNLVSRSLNMTARYFGEIPAATAVVEEVRAPVARAVDAYARAMHDLHLDRGCDRARDVVQLLNALIQERQPFAMAKDPARRDELASLMNAVLEGIRIASHLLWPVMPTKTTEVLARLGCAAEVDEPLDAACSWGRLPVGAPVEKGPPLFPRLQ